VTASDGVRRVNTTTDSSGSFLMRLTGSGNWDIFASASGYTGNASTLLTIRANERVELVLRLSGTTIPLEPIEVTARRLDPRHQATYEGFHERHRTARPVGPERVLLADEPIMRNAMKVDDVLKQLSSTRRRCILWFVNGAVRWSAIQDYGELSTAMLEGMEFYRDDISAPLEYRGYTCGGSAGAYAVVALWLRRADR
jgi:hypothetical protein